MESEEIFIDNAGLVLLGPFYPRLFQQLGLIQEGNMTTSDKEKAALTLQYVLMDKPPLEEARLLLNKWLVGLDLDHNIAENDWVAKEKEIIVKTVHGLIAAATSQWQAVRESSVDSFRAYWFLRKGKLELSPEKAELHVELKPYDILLDQLPYSIDTVNYSWLQQPLRVFWR